jgi:hypothetical protein
VFRSPKRLDQPRSLTKANHFNQQNPKLAALYRLAVNSQSAQSANSQFRDHSRTEVHQLPCSAVVSKLLGS